MKTFTRGQYVLYNGNLLGRNAWRLGYKHRCLAKIVDDRAGARTYDETDATDAVHIIGCCPLHLSLRPGKDKTKILTTWAGKLDPL